MHIRLPAATSAPCHLIPTLTVVTQDTDQTHAVRRLPIPHSLGPGAHAGGVLVVCPVNFTFNFSRPASQSSQVSWILVGSKGAAPEEIFGRMYILQ